MVEGGGEKREVMAWLDWIESRCASADSYVRAMVDECRGMTDLVLTCGRCKNGRVSLRGRVICEARMVVK